ncbi:MAG: TolC family protein [Polyangiaceae bacterium]
MRRSAARITGGTTAALLALALPCLSPRGAAAAEGPPPDPPPQGPPPAGYALTLDQAVQLTLTRNERAKISDLNVAIADAAVEKAFATFMPALTASASGTQHATAVKPPSNSGQAALTVNLPLLNASAFPLYAQARRLADAQRAQNTDDKRLLGYSAASAFFAVLNAQDIVTAALRQLDNARANLASTQARTQAALSSTNDATKAQVDMAGSQREVEIDKGVLENALVQLAYLVYVPIPQSLVPPAPTLDAAAKGLTSLENLVRFAADHRPDVQVSRYQSMAAHDFADEPLLRLVPTLGVQGQVLETTADSQLTGRHDDETLTGTATWTIFDNGGRYADKHSRDAQADISDLNYRLLLRTVDEQVHGAAVLLASAQSAFQVATDTVKYARQNVDETEILYKQGLATALELVTANDSRFTAEVNLATAEFTMAQAYLSLRQAMGLDVLGTELK